MKITIVQGAFLPIPPVAGGAVEKLWFELGREFARRGLAVTHVSRRWPGLPVRDDVDGVAHRRVGGYDRPSRRPLAMALDLMYSLRCLRAVGTSEIVVTNTFFLPLLLSLFTPRRVVYVSVHRYPQGQMRLYRWVSRLQCVSTAIANAVREQAPLLDGLIKVVPNYVPSRITQAELTAGWDARKQEVLFVGRVHPEKGVDLLIRAFAAIDGTVRAGWTLRIVGPHEVPAGGAGVAFLDAMKALAASLDVPVEWTGPVYDAEVLNRAYRQARVFVYPSIAARGEAFPLAPLEAMGQGCPVITSDLSCFADFVVPGTNADSFALSGHDDWVPLAAAIEGLMRDEPRQRAYGAAGLKTVREFSLERVADAFVADFTLLRTAAGAAA